MSPRVGTIVALIAAALLAISIARPKWWAGHPTVGDVELNRKSVNIGLLTASQCNYADDEETDCRHLTVAGPVRILRYVELGLTGVLALTLIGLAISGDKRKGFAKLVMISVAGSAVMSVVMLAIGPGLGTGKSESIPIDYGMLLFFGGGALAIASSAIALMPAQAPRPKLPRPMPMPAAGPPQPAFDVQALLADDALRPGGFPPSPGGPLAGPAGPLSSQAGVPPLFQAGQQLRPLYEAAGVEPPSPAAVPLPTRGPTPMPQQAVGTMLGLDLPPLPPVAKAPPPPSRTRPLSAAPPIPQIPPRLKPPTKPPPVKPPPKPPQPTQIGAAVMPPPPRPSELPTSAFARNADEGGTETEAPAFGGEESTSTDAPDPRVSDVPASDAGDDIATAARDQLAARDSHTAVEHTDPEPSVLTSAKVRPESKVPITTAEADLPPPRAETGGGGPSPACPQCEAPMGWVEEHLRFYCKACKMYF